MNEKMSTAHVVLLSVLALMGIAAIFATGFATATFIHLVRMWTL